MKKVIDKDLQMKLIENCKELIEFAFDNKDYNSKEVKQAVEDVINLLDCGKLRVAEKINGNWIVSQWVKKALLIYMKIFGNHLYKNNLGSWFDKVDQKFLNWQEEDFLKNKIRAVPGCYVRKSAFIEENCVLMPSFINIGSYIGAGTMVDTFASIGSCAQIGKNCHISGGVGIGGVLEPIQQSPTIIEDNCFIGARSEIVEGVIVGEGSVISMGCYIGSSTKIINRTTGEIKYEFVPPYSVVIPGSFKINESLSTYCVVVIKTVDEKTRSKTKINELLRY